MKRILREQRGITLVALITTIIIIIILAGVSVAMLTGGNGVIEKSIEAKNDNTVGEDIEKIKTSFSALTIRNLKKADGTTNTIVADDLKKQLIYDVFHVTLTDDQISNGDANKYEITVTGGDGTLEVTMPSGRSYTVDNEGENMGTVTETRAE